MENENGESNRLRLLILAITFAATVSLAAYLLAGKANSVCKRVQTETTTEYLDQLEGKLDREYAVLPVLVSDWALWNALYEFALNDDSQARQQFIEDELSSEETFEAIDADILIVTNAKGDTLFSHALKQAADEAGNVPRPIMDYVSADSLSNYSDITAAKLGIITFANKSYMMASKPVTRSDGSGDPSGVVYIARIFKQEYVSGFESVAGFGFDIFPYGNSSQIDSGGVSAENPTAVNAVSDQSVIGYRYHRNPEAVLRIHHFPGLSKYKIEILEYVLIVSSGIFLAVMAFSFLVIRRKRT